MIRLLHRNLQWLYLEEGNYILFYNRDQEFMGIFGNLVFTFGFDLMAQLFEPLVADRHRNTQPQKAQRQSD